MPEYLTILSNLIIFFFLLVVSFFKTFNMTVCLKHSVFSPYVLCVAQFSNSVLFEGRKESERTHLY